jgi:hypothetical protein
MARMSTHDPDQRLLAAMSKNPELAAILAARPGGDGARYRRLAALLAGTAVAVGLLAAAAWSTKPWRGRASELATEIDRGVYLAPIKTERTAPGEETAPFTGFAVSVETDPPGALVTIGGKPRGEAPVLAEVACRGTEKIEIRAEKAGYAAARRELGCRADTLVKMTLRLER